MTDLVNLLVSNGFAAVIVAYFLWKDRHFNDQILNVLTELRTIMSYISKGE